MFFFGSMPYITPPLGPQYCTTTRLRKRRFVMTQGDNLGGLLQHSVVEAGTYQCQPEAIVILPWILASLKLKS